MEVVSLRALTALRTLVGIEVVVAMTTYFLVGKAFRTFTCSFNDRNVTTVARTSNPELAASTVESFNSDRSQRWTLRMRWRLVLSQTG
ncbi:hypothetical protein [Nesterenkonia ebinurensis]|uniref:hypothetical protein n=1 Tax=Nesterenkonia ebinurensis TaxID=2608252 RepID=UPI00123C7A9A|nr:hypothetical protein [Nesterenkonia ebinurensis]